MAKFDLFWPPDSRKRTLVYWITTMLLMTEGVLGGIWDLARTSMVRSVVVGLGFPVYVLTILGVWKLLGAVAILVPGFPRLKEWAYAGMFFNYSGAVASHLAVGNSIGSGGTHSSSCCSCWLRGGCDPHLGASSRYPMREPAWDVCEEQRSHNISERSRARLSALTDG